MNKPTKIMTIKELSTQLNVHDEVVHAWCQKGWISTTDNHEVSVTDANRVIGLVKKYGARNWSMYNDHSKRSYTRNVPNGYMTTSEVAKKLGVSTSAVSNWCLKGYVETFDLTRQSLRDKDDHKARYAISKAEVARVKKAIKKYGRSWMHYTKPISSEIDENDISSSSDEVSVLEQPVVSIPEVHTELPIKNLGIDEINDAIKRLTSLRSLMVELDTIDSEIENLKDRRNAVASHIEKLKTQCNIG